METAPSRRNDAQNRALSFPSFLVKRRPSKAAVQAFKDSRNKKKAFSWMLRTLRAAHYLGAGPAFLARAFDFRCSSETFALWGAQWSRERS